MLDTKRLIKEVPGKFDETKLSIKEEKTSKL